MNRFTTLVFCVLTCVLLAVPVCADDPPKKLTEEERKELEAKSSELNKVGIKAYQAGKYPEAVKAFEDALNVARQLYNKADFPDGHNNLATAMNNLTVLYKALGRLAEAESLYKDALEVNKRLFKGDHPNVAVILNNLAALYQAQGKLAEAEPVYKDALEVNKRLFKGDHEDVARSLNNLASLYRAQGKLNEAEVLFKDALEMYKRLFKGDHPDVAVSLNNLAVLYDAQGKLSEAEPLYKDALEMYKRLFKGDHPDVALGLNNLASWYQDQGKLNEAEPLYKDALEMYKRLFKGDHPDVAVSLNNLAFLYQAQGKLSEAEPFLKDGLAMQKRLFKGDHPDVALGLNNLASLYRAQGKLNEAEVLLEDALEMHKRLFKGDHPKVSTSLNNLASLYRAQGKLTEAGLLFKDALEMYKRLFKGDHPDVAVSLNNLASLYRAQGKLTEAEPLLKDAMEMIKRLMLTYARQKSEGEVLTFMSSQQLTREVFLSVTRTRITDASRSYDPATAYPAIWSTKGMVARISEQRQLQARAATTDPTLAKMLAELADARRRRAELLLALPTKEPGRLKKRQDDLAALEKTITKLNETLPRLLPAIAGADKLDAALATDLQKVLPTDAAVVDYIRYLFFEWDNDKPAGEKEKQTWRYLAFVVTKDKVAWVDLDTEAAIKPAVNAWREAITSGKEIPVAILAKVRELVWEKVRKELPASVKTVYVCPDADLCKVPFAALPGDKPNTILLEDYAIAVIPHAPFLLDKLWPQDPQKNPPTNALVVGGVKYDAVLNVPAPGPNAVASRGDPLLTPGQKLGWGFLGNTVGEANGVSETATRKKLPVTRIEGDKATSSAILAALPKAKYAHFATHGFFADASFRSVFQLDENDFKQFRGERVGKAANSPLVMTGLVFAGANNPKTPGRGILTGEQLIDLDLSGLELAVLSACETGLGDVAGGEGTFGLQRAFHYAGTKNVVCSLWKVPDESTAALMNLFYQNLWDKNLTPMESLRQAQLELYRNPAKIPELAKGFRGKFEEIPGMGGEVEIKPSKDGKAHPLLWAAFTLSGPGR